MKYSFNLLFCAVLGFVLSLALFTSAVLADESEATDSATVATEAFSEDGTNEDGTNKGEADEDESSKKVTDAAETETASEGDSENEAVQGTKTQGETNDEAGEPADSETNVQSVPESEENAETRTEAKQGTTADSDEKKLSIMDLLKSGGVLMIPIGLMSVLVVMVGLERFVGLRRGAVIPRWLMHNVDVQVSAKADPRAIYALCRKNHSALSKVIQAALFKAGRPMAEVLEAIEQAKENEANRLYSRVRPLVLAASVTPLIGLLGTVVGMIQAFMATASTIGIHKAEMLSEGIYLALITTCAGLTVAIPAAILAHWYEGKIQRRFYRMDQMLINFIAFMESLEGKVRLTPSAYKAYVKQKNGK